MWDAEQPDAGDLDGHARLVDRHRRRRLHRHQQLRRPERAAVGLYAGPSPTSTVTGGPTCGGTPPTAAAFDRLDQAWISTRSGSLHRSDYRAVGADARTRTSSWTTMATVAAEHVVVQGQRIDDAGGPSPMAAVTAPACSRDAIALARLERCNQPGTLQVGAGDFNGDGISIFSGSPLRGTRQQAVVHMARQLGPATAFHHLPGRIGNLNGFNPLFRRHQRRRQDRHFWDTSIPTVARPATASCG